MNIVRLALRMLAREWRAGELRVLVLAVMIAVAGLASVNAFTVRMHLALSQESNRLLGADLVLVSGSCTRRQVDCRGATARARNGSDRVVPEHGEHAAGEPSGRNQGGE